MLALLSTLALAAPGEPAAPGAGPAPVEIPPVLAPLPPGTTLERVETHAEFVRYHLRTDRAFVLEITPERGGAPVCAGGGRALWVRADLSAAAESFVWDPLPTVVTEACGRLAEHPPEFASAAAPTAGKGREGGSAREERGDARGGREGHEGPGSARDALNVAAEVPGGGSAASGSQPEDYASHDSEALRAPKPLPHWRWRPLHAVVAPLLALLAWLLPRDRVALGAGLLALVVRLALSRPSVLLGGDAAYERLLRARGLWDADAYYGEGWPAFMGLLWRALGSPDHFVHAVNIGLSALTVPYVVALARRVGTGAPRRSAGGAAAGLLLALHPLAVAAAGMEDVFVLVGLLQVAAVATAVDPRRLGPWCAALATGLLVHLRPEQGVFALLPLALLARRGAWAPLALSLLLAAWRGAELLGVSDAVAHGSDILGWRRWLHADFLGNLAIPGPKNPLLLLDPTRSPAALAVLAVLALSGVRAHRALSIPLVALALPLAVVLPKTSPFADPVRFQLAGFGFAAVLAGAGLARLRGRPGLAALGIAALALTTIPARAPLDGGWAWSHEYDHLRAHLADMPAGTPVYYRPDQDPHGHFGDWVDAVSPGRWRPLGAAPLEEGAWYWRGFADGVAGVWPPRPCDFEPLAVTAAPARTDGWIVLPGDTLEVGFYRVMRCDGAVSGTPP